MTVPSYVRAQTRQGKVPLSTKIYQGIGALPEAFKGFGFGTFLLFFYSQVLGASPVLVSLAIGLTTFLDGAVDPPYLPKILVPITPEIAVIICRPFQYLVEPRISSIVLTDDQVEHCNHAIQVYSRSEIFFRSEPPCLDSVFACGERYRYAHPDNPVDLLIRSIPGMPPCDTTFDNPFWNATST